MTIKFLLSCHSAPHGLIKRMTTDPNNLKSEIRKALEGERRKRTLTHLIKEAVVNVFAEQQLDQQPPPQQDFQAPPAPVDDLSALPPEQAPEQATVESMTEKLNVIRGGRSFAEPEVFGQLTTYWKTLTPEAQELLDNQLNEIGKLVTMAEPEEAGEDAAQQAQNPPPPPAPTPGTPPTAGAPPPITPTM